MPQPIKEEELNHITRKVYALYAKHGFDGISMDEVSRQTGISKATLYRYFTSKEDIVRGMVDFMIYHLDSVRFTKIKGIDDVVTGVREFYVKSVLITSLCGSEFLNELRIKFPDCDERYRTAMNAMQDRFSDFYERSVRKGYFRDLSFTLMDRQFTNMLPEIVDMNFLEKNGMTLTGALREYYRIFLCQILTEKYLSVIDRDDVYDFTKDLARALLNDFFIDSIRR